MKLVASALAERIRGSLFVVPMLFVVAAIVVGQLGILLDSSIGSGSSTLPLGLTSTVESARVVLSTVAGATITFAGIAFSVSLLTIQLASTQYSPRVVSGLFPGSIQQAGHRHRHRHVLVLPDRAPIGALAARTAG